MNILQAISEFFKRGFRSTPKLPASEEKITRIGGLKSYDKANIKEEIKINPNLSYTDRITNYINEAKTNPNVFKALSSWDREKLLVGAVLEEKGASEELMKLFNGKDLISCDPKYFESQLDNNFTRFAVPESYYEATLEGVKNRIEFLRGKITISNGNSYSMSAEFIESQPYTAEPYRRSQNSLEQEIVVDEKGKTNFSFNNKSYLPSTGEVIHHFRQVSDNRLLDIQTGHKNNRFNHYYAIEGNGDMAKVFINRSNPESHIPEYVYTQKQPKDLLDPKGGLGWFAQNDNARRLFEGQISEEELQKQLDQEGKDSQDGIEPNN